MGPVTTRSVPPARSEGARTPVTASFGLPLDHGHVGPPVGAAEAADREDDDEEDHAGGGRDPARLVPGPGRQPGGEPLQRAFHELLLASPVHPAVGGQRRRQLPSAAILQICANSSASRLAPPTRAPSTSGPARMPAVFAAFTDPP
jgi:hypothetical protein